MEGVGLCSGDESAWLGPFWAVTSLPLVLLGRVEPYPTWNQPNIEHSPSPEQDHIAHFAVLQALVSRFVCVFQAVSNQTISMGNRLLLQTRPTCWNSLHCRESSSTCPRRGHHSPTRTSSHRGPRSCRRLFWFKLNWPTTSCHLPFPEPVTSSTRASPASHRGAR